MYSVERMRKAVPLVVSLLAMAVLCTPLLAQEGKGEDATATTPPVVVNVNTQAPTSTPPAAPSGAATTDEEPSTPTWGVEWLKLPDTMTAGTAEALISALDEALVPTKKESDSARLFSARAVEDAQKGRWLLVAGSQEQRDAIWRALEEGSFGPLGKGARRAHTWELDPEHRETLRAEVEKLFAAGGALESFASRRRFAGSSLSIWVDEGEAGTVTEALKAAKLSPNAAEHGITQTVRLYYVRDPAALKTVLETVKPTVAKNVVVANSAATGGYSSLTFAGTYPEIRRLRQVVAAIDLPHPTIRFELWSVQLSGSKPQRVALLADKMRERVATTQQLMGAYVHSLRHFAWKVYDEGGKGQSDWVDCDFLKRLGGRLPLESDRERRLTYTVPPDRDHLLSLSEVMLAFLAVKADSWNSDGIAARNLRTALDAKEHPGRWPGNLIAIFDRQRGNNIAQEAVLAFADKYDEFVMQPHEFSPYYLGARAARLDEYLQVAERALSQDIDRIFVDRLLEDLETDIIASEGGDRPARGANDPPTRAQYLHRLGGLASVGRTTLTVISDTTGKVSGSTVSYFDVSQLPPLDKTTLDNAAQISEALQKALLGTGSDVPVLTELWGSQWGLPVANLVSLGMALGQKEEAWSVLKEGAVLEFTPYILPGATRAEVKIKATITHDDPSEASEKGSTAHLTRVAKHEAETVVYLDTYDLFDLSTLSLRTTHPRPDWKLPVLGQIPFIGELFQFPRDPRKVHHESLLIVRASIVPTAMDVGRLHPISGTVQEPPNR